MIRLKLQLKQWGKEIDCLNLVENMEMLSCILHLFAEGRFGFLVRQGLALLLNTAHAFACGLS